MTYILVGNSSPIEFVKREVPRDPNEARALLVSLTDPEKMSYVSPETGEKVTPDVAEWVDGLTDEQVTAYVEENRIAQNLPTVAGESITEVNIPSDMLPMEQVETFVLSWKSHSSQPPAWIEADNPAVQALLIAAFTTEDHTPADKMPEGWMNDSNGRAPIPAWMLTTMSAMMPALVVPLAVLAVAGMGLHLRTNAGRDFQCRVMGDGGNANAGTSTMRPADYLAITENATAPALGDTSLTGELTTGGLGRLQATYAHTASSLTYTLVRSWTSADGTARTINKCGVLNLSAAGTLVFTSLVPSPPTLVAGDSLQITVTVDIT